MNKHTPGPWRSEAEDKLNPERAYGIVADWQDGDESGTTVIAEVCDANVEGVALADATLIAAAPEMLELLKRYTFPVPGTKWDREHREQLEDDTGALFSRLDGQEGK